MASLSDTMPPRSVVTQSLWGHAKTGASALVLGAAFGGGLLFGAADDDVDVTVDEPAIAAADATTEKLEAVREKLRLGFHQELTGPPRVTPEGAPITPAHSAASAARPKSDDAQQNDAAPPSAPVTSAEASSGTEPEAAVVVEKPAVVPAAPPQDDDAAAPDEDEEMIAAPPRAETEEDRTRVARALAKVLGEDAAERPQGEQSFAVQIASTPSEEGAEALVEKLRSSGHQARVTKVDIADKGAMYRVRVGGFSSRDDAARYREKLGEGFVIAE